jgi:6-phosphogluconolactonase/glucosamine-6-phosphate isomerase/deaminase
MARPRLRRPLCRQGTARSQAASFEGCPGWGEGCPGGGAACPGSGGSVARAVSFDAMTLGVGDDGHTASLFPGTGAAMVTDRLVMALGAQPERGLEARITLTAPVLCEARLALVLARGDKKRGPIASAWAPGPLDEVPSRVLSGVTGKLIWLLDKAAAPSQSF